MRMGRECASLRARAHIAARASLIRYAVKVPELLPIKARDSTEVLPRAPFAEMLRLMVLVAGFLLGGEGT